MVQHATDILLYRIELVFDEMSSVLLCELPEKEAVSVEKFIQFTENRCQTGGQVLAR